MGYYLFNLTNATYDTNTSTFYLNGTSNPSDGSNPDCAVWYENHIAVQQDKSTFDCVSSMRMVNVTSGGPFDIYANDTSAVKSLQFFVDFNSSALNQSLSTAMIYDLGDSIQWLLFGFAVAGVLLSLIFVCLGSIQAEHTLDFFSRLGQSAYSLLLLSIVYFQYFALYVTFLMMIENTYFIFYVISSVALIIMSSATFKTAFLIHLERNMGNPNLRGGGFGNSRSRFVCLSVGMMIVNYIVAAIAIRFVSYAIYLSIISSFPLIAIIENSFRGMKRCFSK